MNKLSMGIDVGNSNCSIHCFTEQGEVIFAHQKITTNDESGWRNLLADLSSQYSIQAAFEAGPHYDWLYDLLMEYCFEVQVINPLDFALINRSYKKTDKVDCVKITEALHRGDLPHGLYTC